MECVLVGYDAVMPIRKGGVRPGQIRFDIERLCRWVSARID